MGQLVVWENPIPPTPLQESLSEKNAFFFFSSPVVITFYFTFFKWKHYDCDLILMI